MMINFDRILELYKPSGTSIPSDLQDLKDSFDFESMFVHKCGKIICKGQNYIKYEICPICGHRECFTYYPQTKSFHCFSTECNKGGTVVDYLMYTKNMTLKQAIDYFKHELCGVPRRQDKTDTLQLPLKDIFALIKGISSVKKAAKYDWVLENLFAKGYIGILFGEGGCGKTWLLLYLCLLLSAGKGRWCGVEVPAKKQKILLFEGDAPDTMIRNRLDKLDMPLDDEHFRYVNRIEADKEGINLSLSTKEGRAYIEAIISESKPDLVIIDTLISFIDDEKDAEMVKIIVDELRKYASRYNCHVLICHHSRKRESGEKRNKLDQSDVIGSSIITRLASIVIGVDKYE